MFVFFVCVLKNIKYKCSLYSKIVKLLYNFFNKLHYNFVIDMFIELKKVFYKIHLNMKHPVKTFFYYLRISEGFKDSS